MALDGEQVDNWGLLRNAYQDMIREHLNSTSSLLGSLQPPQRKRNRVVRRYWRISTRIREVWYVTRHGIPDDY